MISSILLIILSLLMYSGDSVGQELEPRTYNNTPININLVTAGFAYSSGNVLLDPTLPIEDLDGELNILLLGYARTFDLLGKNAKFKAFVPYAFGDWTGSLEGISAERDARGFGDIRLKLEWNFIGAPALDAQQFRSWEQDVVVGGSLLLVTPTSDYNDSKLLNLGSNRWSLRPEIGAAKTIGKWTAELIGNVWIFGENDNFFGGQSLKQDPLYVAKADIIYTFRSGLWLGFGVGYGFGGQTSVNGVERETKQENIRWGVNAAIPINKNNGISASYVSAKNDGAGTQFDAFAVRYTYAWGDF